LKKEQLRLFDENISKEPQEVQDLAWQRMYDAATAAFRTKLEGVGIPFRYDRSGGRIMAKYLDEHAELDPRCLDDLMTAYAALQSQGAFAQVAEEIAEEKAAENVPPPPSRDEINKEKAPSRVKVESGMVSHYVEENAAITEEAFHDLRTMDLKQLRQQSINDRRSRIPEHQRRALDRGDRQWNG
jgi:hypothetical protein